MLKTILNWLDERTGLVSGIHHFLDEEIPASAGWHQVLGSVALFAFLTQVFSGLLMSVNYAPTPSEAWDSLRYIVTQATAGGLMRSLHHWGASAMIVVVVLHMVQAFLYGAYKKPREMTWIVGVVMLLLTLAFGLSGYLLAWDNRAYWGTMVTTQITSLAPGGKLLLTLLGTDGSSIGRQTFARFYTAHVTLLPLVMLLLVVLHVYLVRKHGVTPAPGDEVLPKKKFFPEQVYKDTLATFAWFAVVALMVAFVKVPLGHVADPTDTGYIPRPEWYFLFLFQMLKVFNGPLEVFGAIVLPGLAVGSLFLLPFIDRGQMLRIRQRTGAIALASVAAIGWSALTARAIATTPTTMEEDGLAEVRSWQQIPASQLTGIAAFRKDNCASCHALDGTGSGPDLTKVASRRPNDWLEKHFQQPDDSKVPDTPLSGNEVRSLISLVTQRDERGIDAWKNAPPDVVEGARVYSNNQCGSCHTLNDEGGKRGPVLNGLRQRRERSWVEAHFSDPKKFSPTSGMPAYKLNPHDLDRLTTYLMSIPR
jgi:ubiquinol-cytochrome c reductase cytochrome b subunit